MRKPSIIVDVDFDTFIHNSGGISTPPPDQSSPSETCSSPTGVVLDDIGFRDDSDSDFMSPMSCPDPPCEVHLSSPMDEPEITEEERELTAPVQALLDKMNSTSTRMNECESEIMILESQRLDRAEKWIAEKAALVESIGAHFIEKARPVFDAYQEQQIEQMAVNEAVALFSQCVIECEDMKIVMQTAQDSSTSDNTPLADLLELSVVAQQRRETYEQLRSERMAAFTAVQKRVANLRKAIGIRTIEKAWPWFEAYNRCKARSDGHSSSITSLRKEMKTLKEEYKQCMQDLETISAKVHSLRNK